MPAPFKDYPADYFQNQLFPSNVFDLLPDDHDCFVYRDLFEQLDTSEVDAQYSRRGQHAYAPRQVVSILIYAYSHGVFSSRQIEKRCNEDLGFMYIAGKRCPNFRVLSDFRKDQGDLFRCCFKQTVQMALELDMVSLGHVSLDGSKFKANSSKHKAMSYGRMKERERRLCGEIEVLVERARRYDEEEDRAYREHTGYELREDLRDKQQRLERIRQAKRALEAREAELRPGQAIEDKKQISFADKDARIMGKKGAFDYAYNAQVGVDGDAQIIVGQHVSQAANDQGEVARALDELEASSGRLPDQMSLENGYYLGDNLQAMSDRGVEAYIATDRGEKPAKTGLEDSDRPLVKSDFRYDEARDGRWYARCTTSRKWSMRRQREWCAWSSDKGRRWRRIGPAVALDVTKRSNRVLWQSKTNMMHRPASPTARQDRVFGVIDMQRYASAEVKCRQMPYSRPRS